MSVRIGEILAAPRDGAAVAGSHATRRTRVYNRGMATGDPSKPRPGGERTGGASESEDRFRELFEEAMRDVTPIRRRPLALEKPARRRPAAARRRPATPTRFEIEEAGERIEGRIAGFDRRRLARLKSGRIPAEATIDLHGRLEEEARLAVRAAVRDARGAGMRTILVIHGRGLHSPEGPVLKNALPAWLAEPPLGGWVLAFASAPPELGGPGATLVLLRKRSHERRR